jgi:hypothetical protein
MSTVTETIETGLPTSPATTRKRRGPREPHWRPRTPWQWINLIACAALLIYFAFPVYVIISTALKGPGAAAGLGLPTSIDMSGFNLAWGPSRATCGTQSRLLFRRRSSPASSAP